MAQATEVDEVKDILDKAVALEVYGRQSKNIELEKQASFLRLRAMRRGGDITKALPTKPAAFNRL